jgi:hypothetical protein
MNTTSTYKQDHHVKSENTYMSNVRIRTHALRETGPTVLIKETIITQDPGLHVKIK